ncbi:GH36 C-terminal domain-containing protein [Niabella sp. W65]|jgi:alpha-galactosidase|nr:GH36 C-terminal domain-containing protein [Niabella sp. W65]MCH7366205.1 GH36 C-terminal domain-containing protein [Niabella sp. W65]ULT46646.1 GH36 C-terminal domain-containing protein [Niabella sp. I65]
MNLRKKDNFSKVLLEGLNPSKSYRVREINLLPGTSSTLPDNNKILSGAYLMEAGINIAPGKLQSLTSNIIEITETPI